MPKIEDIEINSHTQLAILTDLEPDDILAMILLFTKATEVFNQTDIFPIKQIIVGGFYSEIQAQRMEYWLDLFNKHGIYPVHGTDKAMKVVAGTDAKLPEDGKNQQVGWTEFGKDEAIRLRHRAKVAREGEEMVITRCQEAANALLDFMQNANAPVIVSLKPSDELLMLTENTLFQEAQRKTRFIGYGSFNVCQLAEYDQASSRKVTNLPAIRAMLDNFKMSIVIEAFPVLPQGTNTLTVENFPMLSRAVNEKIDESNAKDLLFFRLKQFINHWNTPTLLSQKDKAIKGLKELQELILGSDDLQSEFNELIAYTSYTSLDEAFDSFCNLLSSDWKGCDITKFNNAVKDLMTLAKSSMLEKVSKLEGVSDFLVNLKRRCSVWGKIAPRVESQMVIADQIVAAVLCGFDITENLQKAYIKNIGQFVQHVALDPAEGEDSDVSNEKNYYVVLPGLTNEKKSEIQQQLDTSLASTLHTVCYKVDDVVTPSTTAVPSY